MAENTTQALHGAQTSQGERGLKRAQGRSEQGERAQAPYYLPAVGNSRGPRNHDVGG